MEKITEYIMEQSQRNTTHLFDLMKNSITASVEMLTWAQTEAHEITNRLSQQGKEQFVAQLEKIQTQQVKAQQEFQAQFRTLLDLMQEEGNR